MTILDNLKAKYHDVEGIKDARNITEAVARIQGVTGPAAGGAIADYIYEACDVTIDVSGYADGKFKDGASVHTMKVKKNSLFVLPTEENLILPTNKEYLNKWSIQAEGDIVSVDLTEPSVPITGNCTLRAVYGDTLTIYFDPNGANGSIDPIVIKPLGNSYSLTLPYGSSLTHPEGKTFAGWGESSSTPANQTDQGGTGIVRVLGSGTKPNTKTFYAIWQ